METSSPSIHASDAWAEQIAASLHAERNSVREFLASQQTRLERAEVTLDELFVLMDDPRFVGNDLLIDLLPARYDSVARRKLEQTLFGG